MVDGNINIKALSIKELAGIVNLYPWYGAARKELCLRMSHLGGDDWGERDYATNALYIGSRSIISDIIRAANATDYSDKDVEQLLEDLTSGNETPAEITVSPAPTIKERRTPRGGDFFSQDDYESVRQSDDNIFSSFAAKARAEEPREKSEQAVTESFCTETLAQIYLEQGYIDQAKYIYSKLILRYPEKSAYFATLIQKLEEITE